MPNKGDRHTIAIWGATREALSLLQSPFSQLHRETGRARLASGEEKELLFALENIGQKVGGSGGVIDFSMSARLKNSISTRSVLLQLSSLDGGLILNQKSFHAFGRIQMSQNRRRFTLMMLALFASLFTVNVLQDKQVHAKGKNEPRLEGQLVSPIGINRIAAVRRQNGQVVSIYIPTTAKLERNNVHVSLTAFKAGDRVQARFTPDGKTVTKFEGVGT